MNVDQRYPGLSRPLRDYIRVLRRDRKAALRECGRLGEKLFNARMVIEVQRHRIKELESKINPDTYQGGGHT